MTDMIVKLYDLPNIDEDMQRLAAENIIIKRAMTLDMHKILAFVDENFRDISDGWVNECQASLMRQPIACFIAEHEKQVIGFASYDASAKGFFGPIGVSETYRKKGLGTVLMVKALNAMHDEGYGYGIIGWVSSEAYYEKTVGAVAIPDSEPGIYQRLIGL